MSDHQPETAQHDRGHSWPTVNTVDLMLRQLERDKATAYWGESPHSDSLAGAEAWLLSLRDWLSSWPASCGCGLQPEHLHNEDGVPYDPRVSNPPGATS